MSPDSPQDLDKFQKAWQADTSQSRVTIDADLLRSEVQRNQREFQETIVRRDAVEVGVGLLLLGYWFYKGLTTSLPWTWWLTVPVLVWLIGFMLVYRMRHSQKASEPDEPLLDCAKRSLVQVEDQIWLLRNIVWWYLLPPAISMLAFGSHSAWLNFEDWSDALSYGYLVLGLLVLYFFVYFLNQRAVVADLEPRREELLTLLASLEHETTDGTTQGAIDQTPRELTAANRARSDKSSRRIALWCFVAAVSFLVALVPILLSGDIFASKYEGAPQFSGPAGDELAKLVTEQREEKKLVGLAAMVMIDGEVKAAAAEGERKKGSGVPAEVRDRSEVRGVTESILTAMIKHFTESGERVDGKAEQLKAAAAQGERKKGSGISVEIGDRWHVGGVAKSVTATMIARLIEAGHMKWSDTLGDRFPQAAMHDAWKPVTLHQLLTDTAGVLRSFPREVRRKHPPLGPECTKERRKAVLAVLANQPEHPAGEKFVYSNVGITIAAAMAEEVTGQTWETLVRREVFEPLGLTGSGFGPPKSSDERLEQPRGHRSARGWKVAMDDQTDNTAIMGPSGFVHMTLSDLCRYATEHLRGELGEGKLLTAETFQRLHTPEVSYYACGWIKQKPGASFPHTLYWHNGSNTMWYALVAFVPESKMVVAVTSNDGDFEKAEAAAWEIVQAIANPTGAAPNEAAAEYAKQSPFAAVRWQESQPEVQLGDDWFKLESINDIPVTEIVAFSWRTYENKWRKRFEEDLVELLSRMGHPPQDTVTLGLQSLMSSETEVRKGVPMTEENRQAIREAAQAR